MVRYAAFLRGVMPTNCRMPELKRCFEAAGFEDVKTLLGSGNVVFSAKKASDAAIAARAQAAMKEHLGKVFLPFVRSVDALRELIDADPYAAFELAPGAKRVVTFLVDPPAKDPPFPIVLEDARMLARRGREVLSAYVPGPNGPVFMTLIGRTLGKDVTTRTWDTVKKVAK